MTNAPMLIDDDNLSRAWARAFLQITDRAGRHIAPLLLSVTCQDSGMPSENSALRTALDRSLVESKNQPVETVANTIFPATYWKLAQGDRNKLYKMYRRDLPRIKALAASKNRRGLYFERLISFGNQLEFLITQFKAGPGVRTSMFQASVFDPNQDHVALPYLGFPCLQHVTFVPDRKEKRLALNAFYATQQIFEKAYGNYLGLCRLGQFMAQEMGLTLARMNCFIGVEKFDKRTQYKAAIAPLIEVARDTVSAVTNHSSDHSSNSQTNVTAQTAG